MKLKKLAAKISSLILVSMCCFFTKASAENTHLYGTCLKGIQKDSNGGVEIIINEVDKSLIYNPNNRKEYTNSVKCALQNLKRVCKKPIFKITFEGITYELFPKSNELIISGCAGCSPEAKKSVLNVLGLMPIFKPHTEQVRKWSVEKGQYITVNVTHHYSTASPESVQKVTFRGDIKCIPKYFLKLGYMPDPEGFDCDSLNSIHPQIIDLGISNVEKIGHKAFNVSGIQKVILPQHPVHIESRQYETVIGCEGDNVEIENKEYARYEMPTRSSPDSYDNSCCIVA